MSSVNSYRQNQQRTIVDTSMPAMAESVRKVLSRNIHNAKKINFDIQRLSRVEKLARNLVLNHFKTFSRGHLIIREGAVEHHFGGDKTLDQKKPLSAKEHSSINHNETEVENFTAVIDLSNPQAYSMIAFNGILGASEAYMDGLWQTDDLVAVVRFMVYNMNKLHDINKNRSFANKLALKMLGAVNKNSLLGSKQNICAHYDLGNDFFKLFLDSKMMYSSAMFKRQGATDLNMSLEEASIQKLENLCKKLELKATDHLLEIGTGWGGLAIYAAKNYGCKVTTTTISEEQYRYAKEAIVKAGLQEQIILLKKDYRELKGTYDKLVSVEMIEAVGHQFFSNYFDQCNRLLKDNGLMAIQAITILDQRYEQAKNSMDFIKRYIFPGGCLPSVKVIADHIARDTNMTMLNIEDITLDYALTLQKWREAFFHHLKQVKDQGYDQRFINMWNYYLCYCEGGFRERVIGTSQFLFAKPDYRPLS